MKNLSTVKIGIIILLLFAFMGCGGSIIKMSDDLLAIHEENTKNSLALSERTFATWITDSAFLREVLNNYMGQMEQDTIDAWDLLDEWAEQKERSDAQLMRAIVLRARVAQDLIRVGVQVLPTDLYERLVAILW